MSKVSESFNRAVNSYDQACQMQMQIGHTLLLHVMKFTSNPRRIIDLGCGTGITTQQICHAFHYEELHAVDIAEAFLLKAQARLLPYPGVKVYRADFQNKIISQPFFDLMYTNMALQWSHNLFDTLKLIYEQLQCGGIFSFTIPVAGTLLELNETVRNSFYAYSIIKHYLCDIGFTLLHTHEDVLTRTFDSPRCALRSLKAIGANHVMKQRPQGLRGKRYLQTLWNASVAHDVSCDLSYWIAYFVVSK